MSVASDTGTPRRRRRSTRVVVLAVVLAIVGALVGAFVGLRLAAVHTASASVLVTPLAGNPYSPTGNGTALVNLETEAQLVGSAEVVAQVAQKVPETDATTLQSGLTVSVPANTQILTVAYASSQTSRSVEVAQAFAEGYLDQRVRRASALLQTQVDQVNEQISSVQKQQSRLGDRLDDIDDQSSGRAAVLRAQVESTTSQLDQLKANLADLQSTPLTPGQVITPAAPPAPSAVPYWALGGLAGLLAGVVLGVLLGSLSRARSSAPGAAGAPGAAHAA